MKLDLRASLHAPLRRCGSEKLPQWIKAIPQKSTRSRSIYPLITIPRTSPHLVLAFIKSFNSLLYAWNFHSKQIVFISIKTTSRCNLFPNGVIKLHQLYIYRIYKTGIFSLSPSFVSLEVRMLLSFALLSLPVYV
jgi:hypothetical protein